MGNQTRFIVALLVSSLGYELAFAQAVNPTRVEKVKTDTAAEVRRKLDPLLHKYCGEACEVISVDVRVDETLPEMDDLGFEGSTPSDLSSTYVPGKVTVAIQIDDRITAMNRDRIQSILLNHIRALGVQADVQWQSFRMPQIGAAANVEEQLKRGLENRLTMALNQMISEYCPEECVISQLNVEGKLISPDEAGSVPLTRILRDESTGGVVRVDDVRIDLGVDDRMTQEERVRISSLARAKTKFAAPVSLEVNAIPFPESFSRKKERLAEQTKDPYGLEKLRETLKIFRELAGTKEIISSTNAASTSANTNSSRVETSEKNSEKALTSSEKSSLEQSRNDNTNSNSTMSAMESAVGEWGPWIAALLVLGGIVLIFVMRLSKAKQDAKIMLEAADSLKRMNMGQQRQNSNDGMGRHQVPPPPQGQWGARESYPYYDGQVVLKAGSPPVGREEAALRIKREELMQDILQLFMQLPKVAKDTLKRILMDEGVEETAKLVHIFGEVIVYELLNDPALRKELLALSEFYGSSHFSFTIQQEIEILQRLRIKATAAEIRIMSSKSNEKYEFLNRMDAGQIYNLIADEKAQVQAIALTQLEQQKRMSVFDMFEGMGKVNLMAELSRADAIPKEYLFNVAQALANKVRTSPEFDTEQVRSSEILLDLMEKSDLFQQRELMRTLQAQNAETARAIKMKLVTAEILPFIKSGILIELILGLDRRDLVTFLAGTKDHIRGLMLSKAPPELAESWGEDLSNAGMVDDASYQLVELKILNRIRNFASTGVINLLQVNDVIFQERIAFSQNQGTGKQTMGTLSRHAMVA